MTSPAAASNQGKVEDITVNQPSIERWRLKALETFLAEHSRVTNRLRAHPERYELTQVSVRKQDVIQTSCTGGGSVLRETHSTMQVCAMTGVNLWLSIPDGEIIECHEEEAFLSPPYDVYTVVDMVDFILFSKKEPQEALTFQTMIAGLRTLASID